MNEEARGDASASDPPVAFAVIAGIVLGLVASVVGSLALTSLLSQWTPFAWAVLAVPPLLGVIVLLVPQWRRVGAGFVLGLAVGAIAFAGVCAGFITWLNSSLGG
jgi:hypothetical protein